MDEKPSRSVFVLLTSHWLSMAGVALVTLAGFSWIFVLPASLGGHVENPYIGLLVFIAIPAVFFAGLVLIPIGIALGKRRVAQQLAALPDRRTALRRAGIFFAVMTAANVVIGSQLSYRAVEHMDTTQFCGQSCHVMKPEFTAHLMPPHQQVVCAACHIAPGTTGWLKGKMAGTRQLMEVIFNSFPRPIESALESNRLVSSTETCEQCHARQKYIGPRLRVTAKYQPDESNTRTETVLTMLVGGGALGGIHGAHMGPGVRIRYAAQDKKRQTIPWVEYRNTDTGAARTYLAGSGANPSLPVFEMQCVDCHNRAAHRFEDADRAIDQALADGQIAATLPFVKKTGLTLIQASYQNDAEAAQRIPEGLTGFYRQAYPDVAAKRTPEIQAAAAALLAIYQRNVFPDLKVTWGTYLNNLGHVDSPGCFRCHDGGHSTASGQTITQDCDTCHKAVAVEEPSPEVLKTLGITR
ncbi:MAG: NapC/NirT family cytochrome c [Acidobacteriia bacterium]|nr:NapC/NirT family cytochrome c [Terriglobia bacterium]